MQASEKPSIESMVAFFKAKIQGCYVGEAEIEELKTIYPNVSYKDIRRVFYEAVNKNAMQPVSYMTRRLRVLKPEGDPFNLQVNSYSNNGKRVEKGIDWQEKYAEIRAKRAKEEQQYDQRHGPGSWRKKQDQECQQIHLGFVALEKHPATRQQEEVKGYDSWSDEDRAWYDNLVQGVFDEIHAEEQRRKEARKQAEAHRKWKALAKNA